MSDMVIKKATRQGIIPLIGLYGESGTGKTYSALLLARGFVGPEGKLIVIDTENRRAELYADVIPGGYEAMSLSAPFSPMRYREALSVAIAAGARGIIVDSMSHEWENVGGVLEMAHENEMKSGVPGLHNWKVPKMEHAKLVLAMNQSPVFIVACMRASFKSKQTKGTQEMADEGKIQRKSVGKTVILKDEDATPIQAKPFIYEMTVYGEITQNHAFHLIKHSHPALPGCFPNDSPIDIHHGELLRQWCDAPTMGAKADTPKAEPAKQPPKEIVAAMKKKLWAITEKQHQGDPKALEQWLWDESIISEKEKLADLTAVRLQEVIEDAQKKVGAA